MRHKSQPVIDLLPLCSGSVISYEEYCMQLMVGMRETLCGKGMYFFDQVSEWI